MTRTRPGATTIAAALAATITLAGCATNDHLAHRARTEQALDAMERNARAAADALEARQAPGSDAFTVSDEIWLGSTVTPDRDGTPLPPEVLDRGPFSLVVTAHDPIADTYTARSALVAHLEDLLGTPVRIDEVSLRLLASETAETAKTQTVEGDSETRTEADAIDPSFATFDPAVLRETVFGGWRTGPLATDFVAENASAEALLDAATHTLGMLGWRHVDGTVYLYLHEAAEYPVQTFAATGAGEALWEEIQTGILGLCGQCIVTPLPRLGKISVVGRPRSLDLIAPYMHDTNTDLARAFQLEATIYDFVTDDTSRFGIDVTLAIEQAAFRAPLELVIPPHLKDLAAPTINDVAATLGFVNADGSGNPTALTAAMTATDVGNAEPRIKGQDVANTWKELRAEYNNGRAELARLRAERLREDHGRATHTTVRTDGGALIVGRDFGRGELEAALEASLGTGTLNRRQSVKLLVPQGRLATRKITTKHTKNIPKTRTDRVPSDTDQATTTQEFETKEYETGWTLEARIRAAGPSAAQIEMLFTQKSGGVDEGRPEQTVINIREDSTPLNAVLPLGQTLLFAANDMLEPSLVQRRFLIGFRDESSITRVVTILAIQVHRLDMQSPAIAQAPPA